MSYGQQPPGYGQQPPGYGQPPPGYGQPPTPGPSQSPYVPPSGSFYGPPPAKSSSTWLWLLLGGAIGLVVCCGGGTIGVVVLGLGVLEQEVAAELRDNPKMQEHIGEITDIQMDFFASAAEDDGDTFVYDIEGTKGAGRLTVRQITDDDFNEVIEEATLRMKDGTEIQLVPLPGDVVP